MNATASKDFNRKTLAALRKQGIAIIGAPLAPGVDGTFANGERVYTLNDNGTQRVRTFLAVLALAGA